jgi:subfamily B ATP-binding cassette protein HlyB/CyaB
VQRLGDILNTPTEPGYNPGRATLPALKGEVRFEHVSFRYAPDRPKVLDDIDLNIKPGEVIGIVGHSGSGKSTLTKLVQRLYIPESGRALIDGVDLALVEPAWLRRQVGVVLQENTLFNRSVRENIALANPALEMGPIVQAANWPAPTILSSNWPKATTPWWASRAARCPAASASASPSQGP